jgi:predicted DNA-binding transcriptional regulator AlpA
MLINGRNFVDSVELAKTLGISLSHLWHLWRTGRLPGYRFSHRCLRFDLDEVLAAVKKRGPHKSKPTPQPGGDQ